MTVDYEFVRMAVQIAAGVCMPLASMAYTWVATKDKDNSQHIKAVETTFTKAIAEQTMRIERMETRMQYLPTPDQISELKGNVKAMQATQEAILSDMSTVRGSLARIEDYLLKK